jgi:uncharacterized DUF497 family protein
MDAETIAGFEWDVGNRRKCREHGVSKLEVESLFNEDRSPIILPDVAHSHKETRFRAIGQTRTGRHVFVVFTIRATDGKSYIRPISARYMHRKEIESYEKENPNL